MALTGVSLRLLKVVIKPFWKVEQPKESTCVQGSQIPFSDNRWIGLYRIENVLTNDKYIVRWLNTNKTQILHRIRLKVCSKYNFRGQMFKREITT